MVSAIFHLIELIKVKNARIYPTEKGFKVVANGVILEAVQEDDDVTVYLRNDYYADLEEMLIEIGKMRGEEYGI